MVGREWWGESGGGEREGVVALGPPRRSRVVALGPRSRLRAVLGPRLLASLASCCRPRRRRSRVLGPRRCSRVLGPGRRSRSLGCTKLPKRPVYTHKVLYPRSCNDAFCP